MHTRYTQVYATTTLFSLNRQAVSMILCFTLNILSSLARRGEQLSGRWVGGAASRLRLQSAVFLQTSCQLPIQQRHDTYVCVWGGCCSSAKIARSLPYHTVWFFHYISAS